MGRIRYTTPDGIEQVVDLNEFNGHVTIGRTPDCDVYANSLSVSRSHAQVWFEENQYHVLDLNSSNGTFLNGRKIEKAILVPGDLLKCGEFTMVFEDDDGQVPYRGAPPVEEINVDDAAIEEAGPSWEELQQKDEEINRMRGTVADLEDRLAQAQDRSAAVEEELANVRAQGSEEANIARASLEQELEAAQQDISALTAQNNQLTSQMQSLNNQNNQLVSQSKDLANQNSQLNNQLKDLAAESKELNARIAELTAQNREITNQLKNTEKELGDLRRAPPVADGLLPAEELQIRQEMLSLKEEIYRLRKTTPRVVS